MEPVGRRKLRGTSREDILRASLAIVEDEGISELTVRRIAEAVDRKQPAVYQHFASKEEILATIVTAGFDSLADRLERAPAGSEPSLATVASEYVAFGVRRPRLYELMFVGPPVIAFAARAATPKPARRAFRAIAAAVARARSTDDDVETVTEVVWASLHGLVALTISSRLRSSGSLRQARLQRLVATIVATACQRP